MSPHSDLDEANRAPLMSQPARYTIAAACLCGLLALTAFATFLLLTFGSPKITQAAHHALAVISVFATILLIAAATFLLVLRRR